MTKEVGIKFTEIVTLIKGKNNFKVEEDGPIASLGFRIKDRSVKDFRIIEMFPVKSNYSKWEVTIISNETASFELEVGGIPMN
ncbi:hypothetical protein ACJ64_15465 [Bacillus safensis]|nr:hypothetical protein ACJ64_15465 [Bacillus safensis]